MCRRTLRPDLSLIIAIAALLIFYAAPAEAQVDNTFRVTVDDKTSAHPESDRGFPEAYVVDGEQGRSLAVVRGETYTFQMDGVPEIHPFYITESAVGLGDPPYSDGVTGNFASGDDELTFTPGEDTPDVLYYQCQNHEYMGWRIYVMDDVQVALESVATGLTSPVAFAQPDDGSGRLFIVDQVGQIRIVTPDGTLLDEPFLDVADRMVTLMDDFDERGLLGLAFHPDYQTNGRFFVYYSAPLQEGAPAEWDNTATISEFQVSDADANVADSESEKVLLEVDEPQFNHAGGTVLFGPDGYLYISLGDGGGADDNDVGHVSDWYDGNEGGNAQNVEENLLGKILRIDVDGGDPYGIPSDNPFADGDGLDEIYAYGLRNPYRMSFDIEHGLLAGDAGQNRWEEVSRIESGGNYGWNVKEGTHCFSTSDPTQDAAECPDEVGPGHPDAGAPLIDPVVEYRNVNQGDGVGLVVVGGVVYRGSAIPEMSGKYVFGDWSSQGGEADGVLLAATPVEEGRWPMQEITVVGRENERLNEYLLGFGQDEDGEIYVMTSETGGPTGTGTVYRLTAPTNVAREADRELPDQIALAQNYPNPFNPSTTIRFDLERAQDVRLTVYDVLGREVAVLVDRQMATGSHEIVWDGLTDDGEAVPSGTYIYRLRSGDRTASRAMTLVK